jgi:hypothetical protein
MGRVAVLVHGVSTIVSGRRDHSEDETKTLWIICINENWRKNNDKRSDRPGIVERRAQCGGSSRLALLSGNFFAAVER